MSQGVTGSNTVCCAMGNTKKVPGMRVRVAYCNRKPPRRPLGKLREGGLDGGPFGLSELLNHPRDNVVADELQGICLGRTVPPLLIANQIQATTTGPT